MYLKSLTLKGFKSFADATELAFEPAVNVVVGPNGSGKSNVVDAIAWVLGMQSPSMVRAQKMDDIVFAGSATRKTLGRAEVSLVIDNHSGLLPIDFPEVTISRTLFRSGQSEYTLNGDPCRLRDITELLSDAGIGQTQHTIVSQGQIEETLNAGPATLRMIVEEAAGMLKHRRRREQAERQLVEVEANLVRAGDLLREVRRQIKPLKQQAEAARQHADAVATLTRLQQYLAGRELAELTEKRRQLASQLSHASQAESQVAQQLADLESQITGLEQDMSQAGQDEAVEDALALEAQRANARERLAALREQLAELDREAAGYVEAGNLAVQEAEVAQLTAELAQATEQSDELLSQTQQLDARDEELAAVLAELDTGSSKAPAQGASRLDLSHSRRSQIEQLLQSARSEMAEAEADRRHYASRADALAATIAEARARSGAQALAGWEGVLGTLLELVSVDAGWELAFEAALEEAVAAVVIDDPAKAKQALEHLAAQDTPGAVLAVGVQPAKAAAQQPLPAGATALRPYVQAEAAEVSSLLDVLLAGVVVKENQAEAVDFAIAHPELCVVTRGGDRFGTAGHWQVGAKRTGASHAAWEEAKGNEQAAEQRRSGFQDQVAKLEAALRQAEATVRQRGELEVKLSALQERQQMLSAQLQEREQALAAGQEASRQAAGKLQQIQQEKQLGESLLEGLETEIAAMDVELQGIRQRRSQQSQQVQSAIQTLDSQRLKRRQLAEQLAELQQQSLGLASEETEATVRLESLTVSLRRDLLLEPSEAMALEAPELPEGVTAQDHVVQLQDELAVLGTVNPLALEEYEQLAERERSEQAQIDDIKAARKKLREAIAMANGEIANEFLLAYEDVAANFAGLFAKLFPGGSGQVQLTDPENLLETGIEIMAQPSDKKVSRLSLLSGGERSLVALAFLFAVFMSRPSPFYVLDEVDAALDQMNVGRYLAVLDDFRRDSQLIIITHQRLTVERADCLWGVSMPSGGVSKVVSQRVSEVALS